MRHRARALAAFVALGLGAPALSQAGGPSPIIARFAGRAAPAVAALDRQGRAVVLGRLRGKVVVVNLWASWCVPCRTEMPSLERLAAAHPRDLVVLAVANDEGGWPAVYRFWRGQFPHLAVSLAASPDMAEGLGVLALPYSFVIGRDGREIARLPKATAWDKGDARLLIEQAIARR